MKDRKRRRAVKETESSERKKNEASENVTGGGIIKPKTMTNRHER